MRSKMEDVVKEEMTEQEATVEAFELEPIGEAEQETDYSENAIRFQVQMTTKEVHRFSVYHSYHSFSGLIGVILSLGALFVLITQFGEMTDQSKTVLTIVAAWFLILEPIMLYVRSKNQVKFNKAYQQPLHYVVTDDGITISQGEQSQSVEWKHFVKIIATKKQYLVYSSRVNAFIFPKDALGEQCKAFEEAVIKGTKGSYTRIKGIKA